jgi:Na+-driven multidrug efflux pump
MKRLQKREINMTEGPLLRKILLFSLPIMATNLLQTFYNAADMMVVGLSSEPDAVGAIGTTAAFVNLLYNVFMGFATGANVVVARYLGAKENERTSRSVHTALLLSVLLGSVTAVLGLFVSRPILALMGNEGKLVAVVAAKDAERAVEIIRGCKYGGDAAIIGKVSEASSGVTVTTPLGGKKKVGILIGEGLPRIC